MTAEVPLLEARGAGKTYPARRRGLARPGRVTALATVDLAVPAGQTVSIIGESGCGKSTLARLLLAIEQPTSGAVLFEGRDLRTLSRSEWRRYRRGVQAVMQDPYSSLPPRMTTADAVAEPLKVLTPTTRRERRRRVAELFERVGLDVTVHGRRYPHELSGGQLQRVAIAKALAPSPRLLVLDEPVSALDVSVRAQVMNLLADLRDELGLAYLLISHDLSGVRHLSDRVYVMYLGRVVEAAGTDPLFDTPAHPYTTALLAAAAPATPGLDGEELVLSGELPSPYEKIHGCAFRPRCPVAVTRCETDAPALETVAGHDIACHVFQRTAYERTS